MRRIHRDTVSRMYTGTLNMLHDTRNKDIGSVTDCIHLNLFTHEIFIYKNWVILCDRIDNSDKLFDFFIVPGDLHTLTAKYIGRSYKYWIADFVCYLFCLFRCENSSTRRSWNSCFLKNLIKQFSVFSGIHILCLCSKNRNSHFHKCLCQLNGRLSSKLHHCTIWFFYIYNTLYIFCCKWLEIKLICNIKVCGYSFRIVIYNDGFPAFFCKRPGTVNRTIVEFYTLSDTDRTRSKYENLLLRFCFCCFVLASKYRIIIWCLCRKFRRTGIYHLIRCNDSVVITHLLNLIFFSSNQTGNDIIREFDSLCLFEKLYGKIFGMCSDCRRNCRIACNQSLFHLYKNGNLIDKPKINFCNLMNMLIRNTTAKCFCNDPDSTVIHNT